MSFRQALAVLFVDETTDTPNIARTKELQDQVNYLRQENYDILGLLGRRYEALVSTNRGVQRLSHKAKNLRLYKEAFLAIKELALSAEVNGDDNVDKDHILNIVAIVEPKFRDKENMRALNQAKRDSTAEADLADAVVDPAEGEAPVDKTHWNETAKACS